MPLFNNPSGCLWLKFAYTCRKCPCSINQCWLCAILCAILTALASACLCQCNWIVHFEMALLDWNSCEAVCLHLWVNPVMHIWLFRQGAFIWNDCHFTTGLFLEMISQQINSIKAAPKIPTRKLGQQVIISVVKKKCRKEAESFRVRSPWSSSLRNECIFCTILIGVSILRHF